MPRGHASVALPLLQQNRAKDASIIFCGRQGAGGGEAVRGSQSCQHQHREPAGCLGTLVKHLGLSRLL